jgi:HlyD family secretion protein
MKKILPVLSLLVVTLGIGWGVFLIRKNTPRTPEAIVRFEPPQSPSSRTESVSLKSKSEPSSSQSEPRRSELVSASTGQNSAASYLGGIGIIEPAGEAVTIGSQLSGVVHQVHVVAGDKVEVGAPLFTLDQRTASANVEVARANLESQQSRLNELLGQVPTQRARVDSALAHRRQAEATLANAKLSYERSEVLLRRNALSQEEFEDERLNLLLAEANLEEAKAKHREAEVALDLVDEANGAPTIDVQRSVMAQSQAALEKEKVALEQHIVTAPKAGTILQVKVRAGEYVPAAVLATPLITLGVTDPLHVRVDIDETEIGRFEPTSPAVATVRGNTSRRVSLTFVRVEPYVTPKKSLTGGTSERVDTRVLQIIYSVAKDEIQAYPGQQVDVYIETRSE